jgi:two-component system sensor histidine kinase YesM
MAMAFLRKLGSVTYRMNLRTKLILTYLLLIVLPVILLGALTYSNVRGVVVKQTGSAYLEALRQAKKNIGYRLEVGIQVADTVRTNPDILRVLKTMKERPLTAEEEIDDYLVLMNQLAGLQSNSNIVQVRYFVYGNAGFVTASPNVRQVKEMDELTALAPLTGREVNQLWLTSDMDEAHALLGPDEVAYVHEIRSLSNINDVIGFVMVEMDAGFIWDILHDIQLPPNSGMAVQSAGRMLAGFGLTKKSEAAYAGMLRLMDDREGILSDRMEDNTYYAVWTDVDVLPWKVTLLLTAEQMAGNSRGIRQFIVIMSTVVCLLAISFAYWFSGSITKRLKRLIRYIRKAEAGNFEQDPDVQGTDEYARLQRSFNRMSMTIKELIEEVYKTELSKQDVEMKLLYAQINPHFLYNTLDIIRWSALRYQAADIAHVTDSLAKFLRLSLNEGRELITVANEVEEVARYMDIINYRYRGAIRFLADVGEDVRGVGMIKMVLQPLVENAVLHGIMAKEDKRGTIRVKASRDGDDLVLSVIDDGVGMTKRRALEALEQESRGYGVKNVHRRIQVYYGEQYGLRYYTAPGIGCCAFVRLRLAPR